MNQKELFSLSVRYLPFLSHGCKIAFSFFYGNIGHYSGFRCATIVLRDISQHFDLIFRSVLLFLVVFTASYKTRKRSYLRWPTILHREV